MRILFRSATLVLVTLLLVACGSGDSTYVSPVLVSDPPTPPAPPPPPTQSIVVAPSLGLVAGGIVTATTPGGNSLGGPGSYHRSNPPWHC